MAAATRAKPSAGPRLRRLRLWSLVALGLVAALAAAYMLWLRDSGLVAVENVEIVGLSLPGSDQSRGALEAAAKEMTTLNVREDELREAVAGDPRIETLSASADFPRGLEIVVVERRPVLVARAGGRRTVVAHDGTLIPGLDPADLELPSAAFSQLPERGVAGDQDMPLVTIAAAVPEPLLAEVERVSAAEEDSYVATLTGDIEVRLGASARAEEKWQAAAAVLADPSVEQLGYVDVSVPGRPAIG